jgi:uncharacterized lipoprotein
MFTNLKLFIASSALVLLAACGNDPGNTSIVTGGLSKTADTTPTTPTTPTALQMSVDSYSPPVTSTNNQAATGVVARNKNDAPAPKVINLGLPPAASMSGISSNDGMLGKPLQISFGRDVIQTMSSSATQQLLDW